MAKIKIINFKHKIKKDKLPLIIGYFGCVHVMHNQLLSRRNLFNILTFKDIDSKKDHQIYSYKTRINNLKKYDPQTIYVLDLDKYNMTAKEFVDKFLKKLAPTEILVGQNFKFGSDFKDIEEFRDIFKVQYITYVKEISCQKIYELLAKGKIQQANDYLAWNICSQGKWVGGKKLGRKLGFPTINTLNSWPFLLAEGSYITRMTIKNKVYNSVTFIHGEVHKRTNRSIVETHALDAKIAPRLLYPFWIKNNIKIEFLKFIRSPQNCKSHKELKELIGSDVEKAKKYFKDQVK